MRNTAGNPGMAKAQRGWPDAAGSAWAGLMCLMQPVGAWLHGAAGDRCAEELGEYSMTPTDMLTSLAYVTAEVLS